MVNDLAPESRTMFLTWAPEGKIIFQNSKKLLTAGNGSKDLEIEFSAISRGQIDQKFRLFEVSRISFQIDFNL